MLARQGPALRNISQRRAGEERCHNTCLSLFSGALGMRNADASGILWESGRGRVPESRLRKLPHHRPRHIELGHCRRMGICQWASTSRERVSARAGAEHPSRGRRAAPNRSLRTGLHEGAIVEVARTCATPWRYTSGDCLATMPPCKPIWFAGRISGELRLGKIASESAIRTAHRRPNASERAEVRKFVHNVLLLAGWRRRGIPEPG